MDMAPKNCKECKFNKNCNTYYGGLTCKYNKEINPDTVKTDIKPLKNNSK